MISEVKPDGRISCTKRLNISSGAVVRVHEDPKPDQRGRRAKEERGSGGDNQPTILAVNECGTYVVDHIDKGLRVVPAEVTDHLNLVLAREYGFN